MPSPTDMPQTDLSLGQQVRTGAPYWSLCVEILMVAVRDCRAGRRLTAPERRGLRWWAERVGLAAQLRSTNLLRSDR
jgi:hypothetical protein